ncbi:metallophosphoesterase family protein [Anaeromicrobium sediminis]|uniref:Phosphoesterase n=1 Tax=Anaeromicrobium sediminis TaxID=1478221 RepID=A0A267MPL6_9FIRM|nr:metallophosphoesterase family protein [Anaeromicrobium sediminis]PAB60733.1 YfcE family phosphodiesterase [Anaeromicrobium sediminis]
MRIGFITDIHSNKYALEEILKDTKKRNLDKIFCMGDLVGYGPFPNEVINKIKEEKIPTIQGNYDQSVGEELMACGCDYKDQKVMEMGVKSLYWTQENTSDENKKWLRELPKEMDVEVEENKIKLVHGSPRRNNEYLYEDADVLEEVTEKADFNILVCGHTHKPYGKYVNNVFVVNAGSVGKPKHGNPNGTYVILDIKDDIHMEIVEVEYDYEKMAKAIEESEIPSAFAEKIRKGIS